MLSIKYQSTWKVCCRIIEIIRREMIILSSSSSKKKKEIGFPTRGCRLTLPPVLSNRGTPLPRRPTSSLSTCERASTFPFFLFKHNTPSRTFPARVSIQRERERERERVEGVRFHWGWLVERDESVDRNGLMAWKSRPTDAFRRGPDRWAPSRFWREPWPFTILGWKFERHRNGFDSILIFSKYRMKSIHFLHFLS